MLLEDHFGCQWSHSSEEQVGSLVSTYIRGVEAFAGGRIMHLCDVTYLRSIPFPPATWTSVQHRREPRSVVT